MRKILVATMVTLLGLVVLSSGACAAEKQVVGGAGPSTKVVELFFSKFSIQPIASDYEFIVPAISTKHAGGIKNSDTFLFGRTGRPLNVPEQALNKKEIFLAKVPIAFATGEGSKISALELFALEKVFRGGINNWRDLGGPDVEIITVGREATEALFSELKGEYPFFNEVVFDVIFKKDHEVVEFLRSPVGQYAIAFGAKPNFGDVRTIEIKGGYNAGVRLGLVYDTANEDHPLVKSVKAYANSDAWRKIVNQAELLPIKQ